jgi:HlyD family secretion protein
MTERNGASWLVYALGALCAGAIVAAVLVVGPASSSQATVTRTATVAQGVVQSTVSGSGNLQALNQLNLGFKTSGTVTHIYVAQGQQVTQGQLLASLDPQSAEVTLEQAKAGLQSAEADLAKAEETDGEGSGGSSAASATGGASAAAASVDAQDPSRIDVAYESPTHTTPTTTTPTGTTPTSTTPASTSPAATTPTATTPATTTPTSTTPKKTTTTSTPTNTTGAAKREGSEAGSSSSATKATISTATREANIASARAAVKSDKLTVQSDEQAVQDTNLYAPGSGTIVSLSGQVGEVVSGSGTTRSSSSSGASTGSGASATGASVTGAAGRSTTGTSTASSSAGSTSSAFAVLSDLSTLQLVVPLSETEIGNVKVGQIATVTVEALSGAKLAAHVSEVALLSTSSSGAVSYDVTFQLDQLAAGIKLGMSATAEVVVKQAEGINVPTSAITADSVTVERSGKQVRQRVVTGLAGNTSTIILSGLKAGETVVLPAASTTSSSATNVISRISSRLGGGGLGGGGGAGLGGGGGAAFFRGGG